MLEPLDGIIPVQLFMFVTPAVIRRPSGPQRPADQTGVEQRPPTLLNYLSGLSLSLVYAAHYNVLNVSS